MFYIIVYNRFQYLEISMFFNTTNPHFYSCSCKTYESPLVIQNTEYKLSCNMLRNYIKKLFLKDYPKNKYIKYIKENKLLTRDVSYMDVQAFDMSLIHI